MKKFDNRELISRTGYCFYPEGEYPMKAVSLRRDFIKSVYKRDACQTVEWTSGSVIYTETEIREFIEMARNNKKAVFKRNRYIK